MLKERLPPDLLLTTHDFQVIVKAYDIASNETLAWEPEFSSRQYSNAFVDWIVERITEDRDFVHDARQKAYEKTHPPVLPFDAQSGLPI